MANGGTTISLLPVGSATPAVGVAGASAPIAELRGGPVGATAVSALGDVRLISGTDGLLYVSENGAAYTTIPTGASSPWTRATPLVALNAAGDTQANPFADDVTIFGTSSLRWQGICMGLGGAASSGALIYNALGDNQPSVNLTAFGGPQLKMGPGGVPANVPDVALRRFKDVSGISSFAITDGTAGGDGGLFPQTTLSGLNAVLGNSTYRWRSVGTGRGLQVYIASGATEEPTTNLGSGTGLGLAFGPGGVGTPVDVGLRRLAAGSMSFTNGTGGGASGTSFVPEVDASGSLGTLANRWGGVYSDPTGGLNVYAAGPNYQARISSTINGGSIELGLGGATVPDIVMKRSATAKTLILDDGGGLGIDVVPDTDNTGSIGTGNLRFALVRAVTITSGDVCFDDQTCKVCGQPFAEGEDLVLRVIRIEPDGDSGRRLTRTVPAHHGCK